MKQKTQPQQLHTDYPSECTTIIVGRQHTSDGSMIVARSEDWNAVLAKNLEIYEDTDHGPERFVALDSPFRCDLPKRALGYSPFPSHPQPLADTILLSVSMNLTTLGTSYKWNHTVFVLL